MVPHDSKSDLPLMSSKPSETSESSQSSDTSLSSSNFKTEELKTGHFKTGKLKTGLAENLGHCLSQSCQIGYFSGTFDYFWLLLAILGSFWLVLTTLGVRLGLVRFRLG